MRTISLFMNVTLNGYFEGPNHDFSIFKGNDEGNSFFREQTGGGSTLLLGHRTYDVMKRFWPTAQAKETNPEVADYMNRQPKVVVAHEPFEPGWNNVTVISGDVVRGVRTLKAQGSDPIVILGSNTLCVSLLPEGLIDRIQLLVNPIALGDGTPLFRGLSQRIEWTLLETRALKSGSVVMSYAPKA